MRKIFIAAWLATVPFVSNLALAEEPVPIESIQVTAVRERLVSYQQSYDLARKVQEASSGRVALGIRLIAARSDVRLDDLHLSLDSDTESLSISVGEGGIFIVPVNERIAQEKGTYSINKKKGDVDYTLIFLPAVGAATWTIGLMRQVIADAKNAAAKVVPWYLKPFATQIDSVAVCTKESGVAISIMNGDALVSTVKTEKKDTDDGGRTVFCKRFNGTDKFEDALRVVVPEGAEVILL